jgi:uncharacterized protein (TIGR02145 family)
MINSDGGMVVTSRGVCWSTNPNPTIAGSKTSDGTGGGSFSSTITDLSAHTVYYVRAYATNSIGTAYGNTVTLSTLDNVTDIDGNTYSIVKIGTQIWMAENLKTTKYRNGDAVGTTLPVNLDIRYESNPKYQWAYENNESNVAIYGRLYTGYAASDERGICPNGWHVPTLDEWGVLVNYLGGADVAGMKLKETGTTPWSLKATNESGFTARPGGTRHEFGPFVNIESYGHWWVYSDPNQTASLTPYMNLSSTRNVQYLLYRKNHGHSVRCVKDK